MDAVQIVYVLTNPSMPGLVKIGITSQNDVESRMEQLYTTGVPVPFECNYACKVRDAREVERAIHFAFGDSRVNPRREFFKLLPERVVAILKLLQIEEVTKEIIEEVDTREDAEDRDSARKLKEARRPKLNFEELGIPIGAILKFRDGDDEAAVIAGNLVRYQGEEVSLTMATRKILGLREDYPLQPSPRWNFNGKCLKDIYEDYHAEEE